MIRTAYPLSFLKQAGLRLGLTSRRTRRVNARRHDAAVAPAPAAENASAPKTEAAAREDEKAIVNAFYNRYDDLTALVCLAAQEGVTGAREARYQAAREWFIQTYAAEVREFLAPHLLDAAQYEARYEAQYEAQGDDPFACFWTPPTLSHLLQSDSGDHIARMERTQNALAAWESSL